MHSATSPTTYLRPTTPRRHHLESDTFFWELERSPGLDMAATLPDLPNDRPLAETIAAATRSVHLRLNKLIIANLPGALPPRASDPTSYVSGLLHIAPIYITFEALWQNILDTPPMSVPEGSVADGCDPDIPLLDAGSILTPPKHTENPRVHRPLVCDRVHSMLQHLHLPGLMRSKRLRADLGELTGWPEHVVEEQLRAVSQMARLRDFVNHIKRSVENKPHVLLAYSYIMFMALFSGGRFIRASLESAGSQFWEQVPSPILPVLHPCEPKDAKRRETRKPEDEEAPGAERKSHAAHHMPLRFFHFSAPMDGEDLKREFKKRLSDSEDILTAREKHDIVQEAICIFDNMSLIVHQLEAVCADAEQADSDENPLKSLTDLIKNPLGTRFRDSVVVAKERRARSSSKRSSGDERGLCSFERSQTDGQSTPQTNHGDFDMGSHMVHPVISGAGKVELCPAFAKSMRFDGPLAKPERKPTTGQDAATDLAESLKMATKRVKSAHVTNWAMMAAFGFIILGFLLTGRRGLIEAS